MVKSVLYPAAYTLIEVLVAITIMSIMATIVLFGYSSQRTSHDLDNVAREMVAVVREIRGELRTASGVLQWGSRDRGRACKQLLHGLALLGYRARAAKRCQHREDSDLP